MPSIQVSPAMLRVDVLHGAVEVVDQRQDVDHQGGVGQAAELAALLLVAALVVLEVGRGALPGG